ncbi:hypothetical protein OG271_03880 [Micromonospora rifamycinica]|uniref:hypothetical protein n=1 Tax=Micromonospora rifamycinica TaxID=291594 RepID=UPI002E2C7F2D|nr:hypothetical protein [Micromonospora rifamycinica]
MTAPPSSDGLVIALQAAVPLWILDLAALPPALRDDRIRRWAADSADTVAHKGDILQFRGGKRGETAAVFNALARGIAAAAYLPGGITAFGEHWCVNHAECLDADRQAADRPPLLTADTTPEPATPTYQGRPVVGLPLPEVL